MQAAIIDHRPSLDANTEASPEVLRELHRGWVQQLRRKTLIWAAIAAGVVGLGATIGSPPGGSFWLLAGLIGIVSIQSAVEWRRALRTDGTSAAAGVLAEFSEEQQRAEAFKVHVATVRPIATATVVVIVVVVTIIEWITAGSIVTTVARAGLVKPLVTDGEWWRLVTSTFVHAGAIHLLMNMGALLTFGRYFEAMAPRPLFWVTYITAGVAGSLASWWLQPGASSLGASGAVMGVVAFVATYGVRNADRVPVEVRQRAWMAILLTGFLGALAFGLIDNGAHAGGALTGAVIALLAGRRRQPETHGPPAWIVGLGALAVVALIGGAVRTTVALTGGQPILSGMRTRSDVTVPVRSVTADFGVDRSGVHVTVSNHGGRVLEAYDLTVLARSVQGSVWRDDCCFNTSGQPPVPAGGSVRIPLMGRAPSKRETPQVRVNVAMFDDGSFEGSRNVRDDFVRRRRDAIRDADYWIGKLEIVASAPAPAVASRLQAYADARAHYSPVSITVVTTFGVYKLMTSAADDPSGISERVRQTRAALVATRDRLVARLPAAR